jgi:hypothetical protein
MGLSPRPRCRGDYCPQLGPGLALGLFLGDASLAGAPLLAFREAAGRRLGALGCYRTDKLHAGGIQCRGQVVDRARATPREVAVLLGTTTEGELKMRNVLLPAVAAVRPTASPGSADGETTPAAILKIKDCKLDLAAHTFVDGNGR